MINTSNEIAHLYNDNFLNSSHIRQTTSLVNNATQATQIISTQYNTMQDK